MTKTLGIILIFFISTWSSADQGNAILNVEGQIQINGKTVINSEGKWIGETEVLWDHLEIDCSEDSSALIAAIDAGYHNINFTGDCYAPRKFYRKHNVWLAGSGKNSSSLIREPANTTGRLFTIYDGQTFVGLQNLTIRDNLEGDFELIESQGNLKIENVDIIGASGECIEVDFGGTLIANSMSVSGCTGSGLTVRGGSFAVIDNTSITSIGKAVNSGSGSTVEVGGNSYLHGDVSAASVYESSRLIIYEGIQHNITISGSIGAYGSSYVGIGNKTTISSYVKYDVGTNSIMQFNSTPSFLSGIKLGADSGGIIQLKNGFDTTQILEKYCINNGSIILLSEGGRDVNYCEQ